MRYMGTGSAKETTVCIIFLQFAAKKAFYTFFNIKCIGL